MKGKNGRGVEGAGAPVNELRGDLVADKVEMAALQRDCECYTKNMPTEWECTGVALGLGA